MKHREIGDLVREVGRRPVVSPASPGSLPEVPTDGPAGRLLLDHVGRDRASQRASSHLVEAPVDSAVHAGIVHVIGNRSSFM